MAFCSKCGADIGENSKFCPKCGAQVIETSSRTYSQTEAAVPDKTPDGAAAPKNGFATAVSNFTNTADTTGTFDAADIEQNKVMAVLAYLSWLVLIPLLAAPNSKFARFHANQGLVLAITEIVYGIAYSIISAILLAISWRLAFVITILGLFSLVFLVFSIFGIVNAANGKAKELPIIGKIKILK